MHFAENKQINGRENEIEKALITLINSQPTLVPTYIVKKPL